MHSNWLRNTGKVNRQQKCCGSSGGMRSSWNRVRWNPMAKILDASAILAFLLNEPGADRVQPDLAEGILSAVNAAEVLTVLCRKGVPMEQAELALRKTRVEVRDFSLKEAVKTAELMIPQTRPRGLSLGDRSCMATAILLELPVVTTDRAWA